ncbi:hypothetical protein VTK26DRAFT_3809 [Humicola hyalothermophila]
MVFFQGTLQEGIAAALQQSKSVVCFVTDGEAESLLWEDDFFCEEEIQSLLTSQSVTLRLAAGSQEEGFLAQLYPIPKKPTVVVIKNAELKEYIAAGVNKDEFMRRMRNALGSSQPTAPQSQPQPQPQGVTAPAAPQPQPVAASSTPPVHQNQSEGSSASSSVPDTSSSSTNSQVQSLLAERAAKLAEKKKKEEEEAKRQRAARAKAEKPAEQSKHAETLRKQRQQAREERERILKAIEDDKAARRARKAETEAERKRAAEAAAEKGTAAPFAPASPFFPTTGKLSEHCSLQVRLFDGSTIRSRFSSDETLRDVRRWVDDARKDGGAERRPYVFKVLLTPRPSRTIDVTEEGKSLQELGLTPSSTLILLRAPPKYAAAYPPSSPAGGVADPQGNVFQRFIAYVLAIVTGFFGTVFAFLSTMFSISGPPAAPEPAVSRTTQSQAGGGAGANRNPRRRIAGLDRAEERRNDQQFYNGNSTNFEPRPDDGE